MFCGDIDKKMITLQGFQLFQKMEQGLLSNSYILTLLKHLNSPTEATKKYFCSKSGMPKCFQVQKVYLLQIDAFCSKKYL